MFAKFLIDVILPKKKKKKKKYQDSQKCYSKRVSCVKDTIKYPSVAIVRISLYRDLSTKTKEWFIAIKKYYPSNIPWNID